MMNEDKLKEYLEERDTIISEVGEFNEEDFVKSGISLEEYNNPTADTISRLIDYVKSEYNQSAVYSDDDN